MALKCVSRDDVVRTGNGDLSRALTQLRASDDPSTPAVHRLDFGEQLLGVWVQPLEPELLPAFSVVEIARDESNPTRAYLMLAAKTPVADVTMGLRFFTLVDRPLDVTQPVPSIPPSRHH